MCLLVPSKGLAVQLFVAPGSLGGPIYRRTSSNHVVLQMSALHQNKYSGTSLTRTSLIRTPSHLQYFWFRCFPTNKYICRSMLLTSTCVGLFSLPFVCNISVFK